MFKLTDLCQYKIYFETWKEFAENPAENGWLQAKFAIFIPDE